VRNHPQRLLRPATAFSLDGGKVMRCTRQHARSHLAWLKTLPCLISGTRKDVEAAHIRYAEPVYGKRLTGMGEKPSDRYAVPLSRLFHDEQHRGNERAFWAHHGIDPLFVALSLWSCSGDDEAGEAVITAARAKARK
jgi:hypothetical protein